jgi:UDP-N-acetylmuramate--alanine ligase
MVGIAGSGMRSLADVLSAAGWQISGSDLDASSVAGCAWKVHAGHDARNVSDAIDIVVRSDAIADDNPELVQARALGIEVVSYAAMLGRLMGPRTGVAIAGTHGKSTTTAMAGAILVAAGYDPTVVCGARTPGSFSGGRYGRGRVMLAEACEYRANFCHLKPQVAVISGIEPDHFDCYASLGELENGFAQLVACLPTDGLLLVRQECAATSRAIVHRRAACETFGFSPSATWQATELRERRGQYSFQVRCRHRLVTQLKLNVPGKHNVQNALAAAAIASHLGATGAQIRAGLDRFAGLEGRMQVVADDGQLAVINDCAHHPTEVAAALSTVRQLFPQRRSCCVFQPHQISRTKALIHEFAVSLQNADQVIVTPVFPAREKASRAVQDLASKLAAQARALGVHAVHLAKLEQIHDHLSGWLSPGDVVTTLGAGDIGRIAHELGQGLRTYRQAG